jgi:hypothetical protein
MRTMRAADETKWIVLTDANFGNEFPVRVEHISGITIVSGQTYRGGMIPDGVLRHTLIYTLGGNQFAVREAPMDILAKISPMIEQLEDFKELEGRDDDRPVAGFADANDQPELQASIRRLERAVSATISSTHSTGAGAE